MSVTEAAVEDPGASDEVTPPPAASAPVAAPRKRSNVVPALIITVGLLGGGLMVGLGRAAPAQESAPPEEAEVEPGETVDLEPMTLNLADGRYLRVALAVELVAEVPGEEWVEHGEAIRYKDLVIARVGEMSGDELATPDGREELKEVLREGGSELFPDEFSEVYLTEFVVQ